MKTFLGILVLLVAASPLGMGQSVEQSLMQMERDWVQAELKGDAASLDRILASDWVGHGPTGSSSKAEALADLKSGNNKMESITLGDMQVRTFGDTAVVTGSDVEKSSYKGKDTSGHYTWTDVLKRDGHWQAASSQNTRLLQ